MLINWMVDLCSRLSEYKCCLSRVEGKGAQFVGVENVIAVVYDLWIRSRAIAIDLHRPIELYLSNMPELSCLDRQTLA